MGIGPMCVAENGTLSDLLAGSTSLKGYVLVHIILVPYIQKISTN